MLHLEIPNVAPAAGVGKRAGTGATPCYSMLTSSSEDHFNYTSLPAVRLTKREETR
jgi:hypothetical protein